MFAGRRRRLIFVYLALCEMPSRGWQALTAAQPSARTSTPLTLIGKCRVLKHKKQKKKKCDRKKLNNGGTHTHIEREREHTVTHTIKSCNIAEPLRFVFVRVCVSICKALETMGGSATHFGKEPPLGIEPRTFSLQN